MGKSTARRKNETYEEWKNRTMKEGESEDTWMKRMKANESSRNCARRIREREKERQQRELEQWQRLRKQDQREREEREQRERDMTEDPVEEDKDELIERLRNRVKELEYKLNKVLNTLE